ncbi:hypothetical protein AB0G00_24195 [Nocardia salmonicida]|uniref:hypothetical protein n=1 Tax=Nocardia salmonicida TaxID=53431 RepID=UPI003400D8AD
MSALAVGDTVFWQAFKPSGMTKSGSYTATTSYAVVPTWVADTGGFPGSTVSSNGLVVQNTVGNAVLSVQLSCNVPIGQQTQSVDVQFYRGATLVGTTTPVSCPVNATTLVTGSVSGVAVTAGDIITVRTKKSNAFGMTVTAASWVRITVP